MDRDEFMELVYETFADEPDNVLANGIIEAADAYVEHEKAQLSQEGTTSDLISRQAAIDAIENSSKPYVWQGADIIRRLPTAQPEHKVRFADKDHVWIDGKQYISLLRFQEAVKEAQPKEGHWIEVAGELECSECHTVFTDLYPDYADSVACPHCGAKMKGERTK